MGPDSSEKGDVQTESKEGTFLFGVYTNLKTSEAFMFILFLSGVFVIVTSIAFSLIYFMQSEYGYLAIALIFIILGLLLSREGIKLYREMPSKTPEITSPMLSLEKSQVPKKEDSASYFGGHFKYPLKSGKLLDTGGTTKSGIIGKLRLYADRIEFEKESVRESKRWKIVIPFNRIDVERVGFTEKESGTSLAAGGGFGGPGLFGPMGFGGGLISKLGDRNLLTIPYTDENGIKQTPMFQIRAFPDKTNDWAEILYDKLVELTRLKTEQKEDKSDTNQDAFEKLTKLKELFDKGVIAEDEYEGKRKKLLDEI